MRYKSKVIIGMCLYLILLVIGASYYSNMKHYLAFGTILTIVMLIWFNIPNKYFYIESWKYSSKSKIKREE